MEDYSLVIQDGSKTGLHSFKVCNVRSVDQIATTFGTNKSYFNPNREVQLKLILKSKVHIDSDNGILAFDH